jgi:hypothetical protein
MVYSLINSCVSNVVGIKYKYSSCLAPFYMNKIDKNFNCVVF